MDSSRLVSSRAGRPITAMRPITGGARPVTTGLVAPKSSRGRTGLRRQVQDKTYWIGVLKAKMVELGNEIASLTKESDAMSQDESRMGIWQKKAESLARELATLTHELTVYNEFRDRMQIGENGDELRDEIDEIKQDNEQLSSKLETTYEEKKRKEELMRESELEIEQLQANWELVRSQFSAEQNSTLHQLESQNKELSMRCEQLESSIQSWSQKKMELESVNHSGSDAFLRKEILQGLERVRELEKQRDELLEESSGDERGRLLAQVKRDNKEIAALEAKQAEYSKEMDNIRAELEAYEDVEAFEKYKELKQKEAAMDEFLDKFEREKEEENQKILDHSLAVNATLEKINRIIAHIDGLKVSDMDSSQRDGFDGLLDEKRKLELDMNKIEQLEGKINSELESLRNKIKTLEKDIATYSDIPKLKRDIEDKTDKLRDERDKCREQIADLKQSNKVLKEKIDTLKDSLESNEIYKKIKNLESKLSESLAQNAKIDALVSANDNTQLKKAVFDEVKKYNQKLQGY